LHQYAPPTVAQAFRPAPRRAGSPEGLRYRNAGNPEGLRYRNAGNPEGLRYGNSETRSLPARRNKP